MIVGSTRERSCRRTPRRGWPVHRAGRRPRSPTPRAGPKLTASRARIVAAADQARRRIERDLHDGAQQRLVALALQLRAAQAEVPPRLDELRAQLGPRRHRGQPARWTSCARSPAASTRRSSPSGGLRPGAERARPPLPDPGRPRHARRGAAARTGRGQRAYYVVAEALTNAAKHASLDRHVTVETDTAGDLLQVAVRDDGAGGADFARGTGLLGLKDRVEALGGRLCSTARAAAERA